MMTTVNEFERRRLVAKMDAIIAKWKPYANKAGARNTRYAPMGNMRVQPAKWTPPAQPKRETYKGVEITGLKSPLIKLAVKNSIDLVAQNGALEMVQGVHFTEVKAKGYIANCTKDGVININESDFLKLSPREMIRVVLHEVAHHCLKHPQQSMALDTPAERDRYEFEADRQAYTWMGG
jgi:hypothetical protein